MRLIDKVDLSLIPFRLLRDQWLSYFRVTEEGQPIIAIEHGVGSGTIMHELEHFHDWKAIKQALMKQGSSGKEAAIRAWKYLGSSPQQLLKTERNAVTAEVNERELNPFSQQYFERLTYPERTAIASYLNDVQKDVKVKAKTKQFIFGCFDNIIRLVAEYRYERSVAIHEKLSSSMLSFRERRALQSEFDRLQKTENLIDDIPTVERSPEFVRIFNQRVASLFQNHPLKPTD